MTEPHLLADADARRDATSRTSRSGLHYHRAGSGEPLVLLHGSGPGVSGWLNFGENLPVLAEHFDVLIVDQPGFGGSPVPVLDRPYGDVAADAIVELMAELGIERFHLLGNSMGAATASRIVLNHPDLVDRLVFMGPGGIGVNVMGPRPTEGFKRLIEFSRDPNRDRLIAWMRTMVFDQGLVTDELIDARWEIATAPGALEWFSTFLAPHASREGMAERRDDVPLWARAGAITHRTLMTWGRDDRVVPMETGLLPLQQMPDVELHVFGSCGHWPQVERKDAFERVVIEFLTRP